MGKAADARDPFGQYRAVCERAALKPLLHAPMFEEQLGVQMQNPFANVEKNELHGLDDIGSHRPEREALYVCIFDLRRDRVRRLKWNLNISRVRRIERRDARASCRDVGRDQTVPAGP